MTRFLTTNYDSLLSEIANFTAPYADGNSLVVPTLNTYPSNSMVQVFVEGGKRSFVISDGGGAAKTLSEAGYLGHAGPRFLTDHVRGTDVSVSKAGWLYLAHVETEEVTGAITEIAEVSREASYALLRHFKPEVPFDFRSDLDIILDRHFRDALQRKAHLPGASNKLHTFDYLFRVRESIVVVLDAVLPDASSINSAVVSHMDVKASKSSKMHQFIVYDDKQAWKSADLALLSVGAPPVAFSMFPLTMERLIAQSQ